MLKRILAIVIAVIGAVLLLWLVIHQLGNATSGLHFGRASDWLRLLLGLAPFVVLSFVFGALGLVACRRYPRADVAVVIVAGVLSYIVFALCVPDPNASWSRHPIMTFIYQLGPFILFFVAPALIGLRVVERFYSRHRAKRI